MKAIEIDRENKSAIKCNPSRFVDNILYVS